MIELDRKYVFHVPIFKFEDGMLIELEIEDILDELIEELDARSLYISKVKSVYRKRIYDELLITLFTTSDGHPEEVFERWFRANNDILAQEAFAFEMDGRMFIGRL